MVGASGDVALGGELGEEHLDDGSTRNGEDGAQNAEELAADQQRNDDRHGADANLARHDFRYQDVVFELLLDHEEHDDEEGLVQARLTTRRAQRESAAKMGPTTGMSSPTPEINAST